MTLHVSFSYMYFYLSVHFSSFLVHSLVLVNLLIIMVTLTLNYFSTGSIGFSIAYFPIVVLLINYAIMRQPKAVRPERPKRKKQTRKYEASLSKALE